ncbi:MAG: hypothetical protein Wins2KO_11990 [Winogradskyella sp.]
MISIYLMSVMVLATPKNRFDLNKDALLMTTNAIIDTVNTTKSGSVFFKKNAIAKAMTIANAL